MFNHKYVIRFAFIIFNNYHLWNENFCNIFEKDAYVVSRLSSSDAVKQKF